MITLDGATVKTLPLDELAFEVLRDLIASGGWNEWNYINEAAQTPQYSADAAAVNAISEAFTWLRGHAYIARKPGQTNSEAIFVTREGRLVAEKGLKVGRARHTMQAGLHPDIERVGRSQFLLGQYEVAVFAAMREVEIRVRALAEGTTDDYGVDLMNKAFGPNGPLTDTAVSKGEREGTRSLFAGAYAVLRNSSGHREVDYDDVAEAAEAVMTASLLMRILDRIEKRRRLPR